MKNIMNHYEGSFEYLKNQVRFNSKAGQMELLFKDCKDGEQRFISLMLAYIFLSKEQPHILFSQYQITVEKDNNNGYFVYYHRNMEMLDSFIYGNGYILKDSTHFDFSFGEHTTNTLLRYHYEMKLEYLEEELLLSLIDKTKILKPVVVERFLIPNHSLHLEDIGLNHLNSGSKNFYKTL